MGKLHDLSSYTREDVVVEFQDLDKQGLRTPISALDGAQCGKYSVGQGGIRSGEAGKLATTAGIFAD